MAAGKAHSRWVCKFRTRRGERRWEMEGRGALELGHTCD